LARAATLTVTNTTDPATPVAGDGSLRGAILQNVLDGGGDTIVFAAGLTGTIQLLPANGALTFTANVTITGPTTSPGIAIDAQHAIGVMNVVLPAVTVSISNLTIENGSAANGAGIFNNGGLTVTNCTLFQNASQTGLGGGINNFGTLTVLNSTFSENFANNGGGIINNGGMMTITNTTFFDNSASSAGGGIDNPGGTATVTNSTFSGNSALFFGGGIFNGARLTLTNSTFSGNTGGDSGGGIFNEASGLSAITNCTFSGNSAASGGGIDNAGIGVTSLKGTLVPLNPPAGTAPGRPSTSATTSRMTAVAASAAPASTTAPR